ncbi:ATP-binding protein [Staphylothermus hellenicus]|uniref:ATP-binding protein n=1 Tax=Staphylothermus hellenicus TaxID=84599 RepID=UPI000B2B1565|nr:DUF87 domain-containing protein [Staphylothermus hellenicus]
MSEPVGLIYSWNTDHVKIILTRENYRPGIGDILYTKLDNKYVLLQIVGFEGEIPISSSSLVKDLEEAPPIYSLETSMIANAYLFFEIRNINDEKPIVIKPYQPPPLNTPVYILRPKDPESEKIMRLLSKGISSSGENVPVGWLRSGIAPAKELREEKYFINAPLNLDLSLSIPKHYLVAGQTGAGKTTSVMGIMIQWARNSGKNIAWLIIDRHGEYGKAENNGFADLLAKALYMNKKLEAKAKIYEFTINEGENETISLSNDTAVLLSGTMNISSISIYDLANVLDLPPDKISDLEEAVDIIGSLIKASEIDDAWKRVFLNERDEPTGQVLALLPLLVDNVFRYEGIGEQQKKGIYRVLLNAGIDIRKLRTYRRLILATLGLICKKAIVRVGGISRQVIVTVIDDYSSAFKVSPLLKDPYSLVIIMKAMVNAVSEVYNVRERGRYPWLGIKIEPNVGVIESGKFSIDKIVENINKGETIILDVSKIPLGQGDVIVQSIIRRLFESRMGLGVEKIRELPPIAIVSEEAPLYLSPDKVRSPYNVFARIAREGRKFGLGLIAITQLATQIERQILANFNTIIALRTKFVSDINYFSNIGIPGETFTSLGDREGYLYTPDLRVKEPIPIYIPGYFELAEELNKEYIEKIENNKELEKKALTQIFKNTEEEDEDI